MLASAAPIAGETTMNRDRKVHDIWRECAERIDDLIYDVGMNNGDDTAYYLSLGFRVVSIEANPELIEQAELRFAREIDSGRRTILNIGVADQEGETFPPQSSGGFGNQTLGRWLTYDGMKRTLQEFLRRWDAGKKSIFWNNDKSWAIWSDLHAQYVEPGFHGRTARDTRAQRVGWGAPMRATGASDEKPLLAGA
jgi:hypothetical protein